MVCDTVFKKNPLLSDATLIFYSQSLSNWIFLISPLSSPYSLIDLTSRSSLAVVSMLLNIAGTPALNKSVFFGAYSQDKYLLGRTFLR